MLVNGITLAISRWSQGKGGDFPGVLSWKIRPDLDELVPKQNGKRSCDSSWEQDLSYPLLHDLWQLVAVILVTFHERGIAIVRGVNPFPVIVNFDESKHHAFHRLYFQCLCFHFVNALFFQCGKKGFHSCVIIASSGMTLTLHRPVPGKRFPIHLTGILAASITMKQHAISLMLPGSYREGIDTEFCTHVVRHLKPHNGAIIAI